MNNLSSTGWFVIYELNKKEDLIWVLNYLSFLNYVSMIPSTSFELSFQITYSIPNQQFLSNLLLMFSLGIVT